MAARQAIASVDEDDIKLHLCGTIADRQRAITKLWLECREEVMGFVEFRFPGLPSDSGAEVVAQAFAELVKKIDEPEFDWDQPLRPMLLKIARRRAIDELRKWQVRPISKADFYDFVAEEISETKLAKQWAVHVAAGRANEIYRQFGAFVATLPELQRRVGLIIYHNLPEKLEHDVICETISEETGQRPTVASVKSALRELRRKFHELLNQ